MIHEVDESLRALLARDVVNGSEIEVAFDAPTRDWSSKRSMPTVNLFLYDVREDRSRRQQGRVRDRNEEGRVVEERDVPRRLKLSYLATAWTQRPEDEHRLLGAMLSCFLRYETIPETLLSGSLGASRTAVTITVAVPSVEDRHVSDLWSAIGGELRPALDVVASTPMQVGIPHPPAPLVLEKTRLNVRSPDRSHEKESRQLGTRPPPRPAPHVVEQEPSVISAGQDDDDFDAPEPVNGLPRGRSIRMRPLPGER